MIPTPGKWRQPPPVKTAGDEDEEEERVLLFNGFAQTGEAEGREEEAEAEEGEELEEDEFDYLRLDTIVEEDENSELESNCDDEQLAGDSTDSECDTRGSGVTATPQQSRAIATPATKAGVTEGVTSAAGNNNGRPLAELASSQANSMRKFTSGLQKSRESNNNSMDKCDNSSSKQPKSHGNQPLPSTNRLISEHQVRQQQGLFKALAQRQRLMDELGADERDLMSASLSSLSGPAPAGPRRRGRKSRQSSGGQEGVPLSALDLSSMSDRMLDELLGHIASASSSSLSSNGESLDSSDLSAASSGSDCECEPVGAAGGRHCGHADRLSARDDAPNVVGVHEDERQRQAHRRTCDNQRQSERREDPRDDDDEDQADHELVVQLNPGAELAGSLSPPASADAQPPPQPPGRLPAQEPPRKPASRLEDYFTSGLVNPLVHDYARPAEPATPTRTGESVEEVLARMLEALQEISVSEEAGEQLNELLERGFAHLEQLLQCNLGPPGSGLPPPATPQQGGRTARAGPAGKLLLASQTSAPSKDSDYGSDTQSADCLSQCTDTPTSGPQAAAADSPSPTSLATSSSGGSAAGGQWGGAAAKLGGLSPLAVELSFKLAESLHRLAQQQAARRAAERPAGRKPPMRSVVLINSGAGRPASADSLASSAGSVGSIPPRAVTPETGEKPRALFKTCVNIGGAAVSNVTVAPLARDRQPHSAGETSEKQADLRRQDAQVAQEPLSKPEPEQVSEPEPLSNQEQTLNQQVSEPEPLNNQDPGKQVAEEQPQAPCQLERRRSSRASLRRRPSFSGSASSMHTARPGSPLPRLLGEELPGGEQVAASAKQRQQLQRALVLAQKYNYSPAKLAASKLSSKLQLKELTRQPPELQEKQHSDSAVAINGAQTLKPTIGREDLAGWSAKSPGQQPIRVSGQVQLDISYFAKSGSLTVHVLQCTQLAPVSKRRTTSNPYVKLYLLPDRTKSGKRKSAIQRSQLDPKFDEKFTFGPLALADFEQKTLWLSVWHKDRLGRNEFLGEIYLPLVQVRQQLLNSDLCQTISTKWYPLRERFDASASFKQGRQLTCQETARTADARQQQADKLGELQRKAARLTTAVAPSGGDLSMNVSLGPALPLHLAAAVTGQLFVALRFAPDNPQEHLSTSRAALATGTLQVIIKEAHNVGGFEAPSLAAARHLPNAGQPPPAGPPPNPFCKCYLLSSSGQRLAKQKTGTQKRTAAPRWDHKCLFGALRLGQLACQAIEIQMFNRDSILVSNNEYLGGIRLCALPGAQADDSTSQQSGDSLRRAAAATDLPEEGALCSEREARLWSQMLARPNIWVYGELRLRHLRPLVSNHSSSTAKRSVPTAPVSAT